MEENRIACPMCGSYNYEFVYVEKTSDGVVGCSECIRVIDAEIYVEEEESRAYDAYIDLQIDMRREDEWGLV